MSGLDFINATSAWTLALIIIGVAVAFSVGLQLLTRWRYGVDLVEANHEVAGFKFAVVGVAYAVLLAFVVVSVWDDFERTKGSVEVETERIYNLFQSSHSFPAETGKKIREGLIDYAVEVRDKEWPNMKRGVRGSVSATNAFNKLSLTVGQTKLDDIALLPSLAHAINLSQQIADLRMERLSDVRGQVTPLVWAVLIMGGVVTLGYCSFFATRHVGAQILMTGGLAAIIGSIFFLMLVLNYPFSGPNAVTAEPVDDVIQRMRTEDAEVRQ